MSELRQAQLHWKTCTLGGAVKFGNGKVCPKSKENIPVYGENGVLEYSDKFKRNESKFSCARF